MREEKEGEMIYDYLKNEIIKKIKKREQIKVKHKSGWGGLWSKWWKRNGNGVNQNTLHEILLF